MDKLAAPMAHRGADDSSNLLANIRIFRICVVTVPALSIVAANVTDAARLLQDVIILRSLAALEEGEEGTGVSAVPLPENLI